jgi:GAF domain-containing protein
VASGTDEVLMMTLPLEDAAGLEGHPAETHLLRLLRELAPDAVERQGLMAMPMSASKRDWAQMIFDTNAPGTRFSPEDMMALMSFANACGQALEACETREALAAQAESLGESRGCGSSTRKRRAAPIA